MDYIKTHYTGPRVVISGAGAVDHSQLVGLATNLFGGLPKAPAPGCVVVVVAVAVVVVVVVVVVGAARSLVDGLCFCVGVWCDWVVLASMRLRV